MFGWLFSFLAGDPDEVEVLLTIPRKVIERYDALARNSGAADRYKVIARAMAVYDVLEEQAELGAEVIVRYPGGSERSVNLRP